jgi:hypothetical protein
MGAFFWYRTDSDLDLESAESCFAAKGFAKPLIRRLGPYSLWLYKKTLVGVENYLETSEGSVYAVGTVVYKRLDYRDSLKALLSDFLAGALNFDELLGCFFLLFERDQKCYFLTDLAGQQSIYYNVDQSVLSSSFLASIYSSPRPLHLNKLAIAEILVTGNLIGPDTCIQEIKRFSVRSPQRLNGLRLLKIPALSIPDSCTKAYHLCLDEQIGMLEDYLRSIKRFAAHWGVSSGLTGGLDSRLLMILTLRHLDNFQFFTTWLKVKTRDFLITEKVAKAAGQKLVILPVTDPLDMDPEQALETLQQSFLFFDGLVRTHHLWIQEINTRSYRERLLNDKRIGFNGVGGEQYRNQERMILPRWNFQKWLEYDLVYQNAGDCFHNTSSKREFFEYLGSKIRTDLGIHKISSIDHLAIKRYFNEIYNPANRTVRMNAENQIAFFLCPFTEYQVSREAYKIIPHLGAFQKFEADMINTLSPALASIETHNGFPLNKGDPWMTQLASLAGELIPKGIYNKIYRWRKARSSFYSCYTRKFGFTNDNTRLILALNLAVDINKLMPSAYLSPLIISMGYFLNALKKKISI